MNDLSADILAIREVVENWVLYRDAGDWERFATVWHEDGWMTATWFQGSAKDFIEASHKLFDQGGNILHQLCAWACDISGNRAISQVKMTMSLWFCGLYATFATPCRSARWENTFYMLFFNIPSLFLGLNNSKQIFVDPLCYFLH